MNLTDELQKLAGMHRDGQLTDGEFASAKARLLGAERSAHDAFEPAGQDQPSRSLWPTRPGPKFSSGEMTEHRIYRSSRWSAGNLFFPDRLTLAADGLHFRKGALFGAQEEHISYPAIASLKVDHGIFLSDLTVETPAAASRSTSTASGNPPPAKSRPPCKPRKAPACDNDGCIVFVALRLCVRQAWAFLPT